jgi:ubiquinone/menaquinone biosynthesis C-methylase UbiE
VKSGIDWCVSKITAKNPRFRFEHADIFNKAYNPSGKVRSQDFRFPYPDSHFDFVFLTSVFTHMLPAEVEHYMAEIARVLQPGGRSLITFFLIDAESRRLLIAGKTHQNFLYDQRGFWTIDHEVPETAVAYNEYWMRQLFEKYGLQIVEPIRYGCWSGRQDFLSYQDLMITRKV